MGTQNIEDYKNDLIEEVRKYSLIEWYNLFVTLFLNSTGQEMDDLHSNIVNAANDSFAIVSVKKRYEMNEIHKRIWNEE